MGNQDRYIELNIKLKEENILLKELENISNSMQKEINDNQIEINNLIENNAILESNINQIIGKNIFKANIFLKLFSIIFIIVSTVVIANLSNLNIIVMFLYSMLSPLFCIYINHAIIKLLKKVYRKRNKKVFVMETLISDNQEIIEKYKEINDKLHEDIIENSSIYDKQKNKVRLIEYMINEMKMDYTSPVIDEEVKCLDNISPLIRVKKHDKTREN